MTGGRTCLPLFVGLVGLACQFKRVEDFPVEQVIVLRTCPPDQTDESTGSTGSDDTGASSGGPEDCVPPPITANGVDQLKLWIDFPNGSDVDKEVLLSTDLGVLDPGAKEPAERSKLKLKTHGAGTLTAMLHAGNNSGDARVQATIGSITAELTMTIAPALPTSLELIPSQFILMSGGPESSELSVYLYNEAEPGATVSTGLDVYFRSCSARGQIGAAPKLVRTVAPAPGLVTVTLRMNALGVGILQEVGTEDVALEVYAYVLPAGLPPLTLGDEASCSQIADAVATAAAWDMVTLLLRPKPM